MTATPAMIPLVLDLEKQAAQTVEQARSDAAALRQKSETDAQNARAAAREEAALQVRRLEDDAGRVCENELAKLRSALAGELSAVRQLPADKIAAGVDLVLARLRETRA